MLSNQDLIAVLHTSSEREAFWHDKVERALTQLSLPRHLNEVLNIMFFSRVAPTQLPFSNQHVRDASRRAMVSSISGACTIDRSPSFFVTFAGARGATDLANVKFDLVAFQRAVDATLRRLGLSGLIKFEFDIVLRRSQLADHVVLFHCHGIVRPLDAGAFDEEACRDALTASTAFPSWDGAPGINLKRIGSRDLDTYRTAAYLDDPFHQLKRVQPSRRHPDRNMLRSTRDKLTPALTLRATEMQSYLSVRDMVFGVGPYGTTLRRDWQQQMMHNLPREAARGLMFTPQEVSRLWRDVRAYTGTADDYGRVLLRTRSAMLQRQRRVDR